MLKAASREEEEPGSSVGPWDGRGYDQPFLLVHIVSCLSSFSMAVVTNYCKVSSWKLYKCFILKHECVISQFCGSEARHGSQEARLKVLVELQPFSRLWDLPISLPFLASSHTPWLTAPSSICKAISLWPLTAATSPSSSPLLPPSYT